MRALRGSDGTPVQSTWLIGSKVSWGLELQLASVMPPASTAAAINSRLTSVPLPSSTRCSPLSTSWWRIAVSLAPRPGRPPSPDRLELGAAHESPGSLPGRLVELAHDGTGLDGGVIAARGLDEALAPRRQVVG